MIPVLEIETNGATQVVQYYKSKKKADEIVSIFIMPPSFKELENRIIGRNTESPEIIKKRLAKAREEIGQSSFFEYIVVNNNIDQTVKEVTDIIKKEFAHILEEKPEESEGRKA